MTESKKAQEIPALFYGNCATFSLSFKFEVQT
jgi:hypothetical protein